MVTLDKLREDMQTLLQVDKNLHFVEVNADTIDEALYPVRDASAFLHELHQDLPFIR